MVIFSYTGSARVKIWQKVLEGGYFFDSHCILQQFAWKQRDLLARRH